MFGRGNGQHPVAIGGNVPIIGQPFEIKSWLTTILLICKCDGAQPVLVTSAGVVQCPKCKKGFILQGITAPRGKQPEFNVGVIVPQDQPAGAGVAET